MSDRNQERDNLEWLESNIEGVAKVEGGYPHRVLDVDCFRSSQWESCIEELRSLRETVAKLPKTKDGVPVVQGETVWWPRNGRPRPLRVGNSERKMQLRYGARWVCATVADCYSTAALAVVALAEDAES